MGRSTQAIAVMILMLVGCSSKQPPPEKLPSNERSEVEIGLAEMNRELLRGCPAYNRPLPDNETGLLLQDYIDLATYAASCRERQRKLSNYVTPLVDKAKGAK